MKKMKTQQHLFILITLLTLLLGMAGEAMAAGTYTKTFSSSVTVTFTKSGDGFKVAYSDGTTDNTVYDNIGAINLNTAGITVYLKFNKGTYLLNGKMTVKKGRLRLQLNSDNNVTLKRNTNNTAILFQVDNQTTNAIADARLDIQGHVTDGTTYKFIIDGNATWSVSGSNADGWTASKSSGVTAHDPLVYMRAGRGYFQYVDFQNAWNDASHFYGGAFRIVTVNTGDTPSTCRNYVQMDHCNIKKCYCKGQAGAVQVGGPMIGTSKSYVKLTYTNTTDCFSAAEIEGVGGGIYRTGGAGTADLIMEDCELKNNKSRQTGTITWNSGVGLLTLTRCKFQNNWTLTHGGAVALYSAATITGCTFTGNYATTSGGAISYNTYSNGDDPLPNFQPQNGSLTIDATTSITDNTAAKNNGGGVYVQVKPMNCLNASGNPYTVYKNASGTQYEVHVNINGATISGNTAKGYGGGIYLTRTTDIYKSDLNFSYGTVANNTVTNNNGGGLYVTSSLTGTTYGTCPYSLTNLNVNVGKSGTSTKASLTGNKASNGNGGGIYATGVKLSFNVYANAEIGKSGSGNANQALAATGAGGGVFFYGQQVNNTGSYGTFTMYGGSIAYNTSKVNGAGVYIGNGTCTIQGGSITNNQSETGSGGGVVVNPAGTGAVTTLNSSSAALSISSNQAVHGGGIFVQQGSLTVTKGTNNLTINSNTAKTANTGSGGGVFARGTVTISGATISGNKAEGSMGGGIYSESDNITVQSSASITGNKAVDGAGLYAATGNITIQSNSTLADNVASGNGGGVFAKGAVTISGATISGNKAESSKGGGIYAEAGTNTITIQSSASISGTVDVKTNSTLTSNAATGDGGGIYANGGTVNVSATTTTTEILKSNTAANGGGIYANGGTVNFSDGVISGNSATGNGGGLYIPATGKLTLKGTAKITGNHVPATSHGGGVYLAGVVEVGTTAATPTDVITVEDNYVGTSYTYPTTNNRNNIYLPNPRVTTGHTDVITVKEDGLKNTSRVGFSVPHNFVPVIYCARSSKDTNADPSSWAYLDSFLSGGSMYGVVFDDAEIYHTAHFTTSPYDPDHIYLSGNTWVQQVTSAPATGWSVSGNNVTVGSAEGLAWLISYVNNLNGVTGDHTGVDVTLTEDVDMGEYSWVPIGFTGKTFQGTFNGNGHTVSGISCVFLGESGATMTGLNLGMFGNAGGGATISDVSLQNAYYSSMSVTDKAFVMGGVVGNLGNGTVTGCVAAAEMESSSPTSVMGGIVGSNAGTVKNAVATPELTGYQMGGLAGANSGDLYNSFANAIFDYKGSSKYFGGLVGVNTGTVENCYSRVLGTVPADTYFGHLAGDNTGGNLNYSYAPAATYTASGKTGSQTGLSTFGTTAANAYDYRVRDNQVAATNTYAPAYDAHHLADYQLKKYLNKWVDQDAAHKAAYDKWTRPTTQAINGDYPLLKLSGFNAVAVKASETAMDYGDVNGHIDDYTLANESILFYGSREGVESNSGSSALLYIDEDAVLTQTGDIQAHVGVTLDNSACHAGANPTFGGSDVIDWHFFSSSLANAAIGLEYTNPTQQYLFSENPPDPQFTASSQYFSTSHNGYYGEWDLYAYCERDYHWINLKRNSLSHWHQDNTGQNISYTNETVYNPGQGFMVATAEDCYLRAYGTLNNAATITRPVTYTSGISWTTREGQNLLGNPWQAYLDFNQFASENSALWNSGDTPTTPFYIVMDEDQADYVTYSTDQSANDARASRYIHPHQGFMIKADKAGTATFNNATMRKVAMEGTWTSEFRGGGQPNYARVNLFATDGNGNRDMVTVELGRPEAGGLPERLVPTTSTGRLCCRYEGEDYDLAFTKPGTSEASIRFKTDEDGEYVMTWGTQNGDFSYLHLIDNMTGTDIDCLTADEYKFSSRTSDYESRFRLVFGYTGIDEPEVPEPVEGPTTFAFQTGDQLVVNGEGTLQVFDVTGRLVGTETVTGAQGTVGLHGLPAGVYMLRLVGDNGTQTQKIVIR